MDDVIIVAAIRAVTRIVIEWIHRPKPSAKKPPRIEGKLETK
jgi:hypothetical protein